MNISSVKSLLMLFSGETSVDIYDPVTELSIAQVEDMLKEDADPTDVRLEFLAAAVAYHRIQLISYSRDRGKYTYAGKMLSEAESTLQYSEKLLRDYFCLCSPLIKPQDFAFIGFAGEEEI